VTRALRALSANYVERRAELATNTALAGAGKRAAFALFYGPLHYLLVRQVVRTLPGTTAPLRTLVDLGCGTGVAGVAWVSANGSAPTIIGVDRHPWALAEAARTYQDFGIAGRTRRGDLTTISLPKTPVSIVAAFALNELADPARAALLHTLFERRGHRDRVLIVEPLAGFVAPWWNDWADVFVAAGGRADEWRINADLPPIVTKLDRAAGLNHRELTGRSLWLPGPDESSPLRSG
jgi:Methyltransferase domain